MLAEVSFSEYGERGSIDLLATHVATRGVAVFEMKTELGAVEETIRRHDMKARLAPKITFARLGWRPVRAARVLVLPEGRAARSVIARHAATFDSAYPLRGHEVRAWLRAPARREGDGDGVGTGGVRSGLWFLTLKHRQTGKQSGGGSQRIRRPHPATRERGRQVGQPPNHAPDGPAPV